MEMSPEVLRDLCKKYELYRTPQLNDALYCSLQGFRKIANLEPYTGLVSLFLEGNAITSLDGLPFMPHLRCLYLQQNILSDLVGLELLPGLRMLNISHNSISNLAGLQHCTTLSTLICSRNSLTSYDSINALSYCKELSTVDLQDNKLGSDAVFGNLTELPQISCLYLRGNPVTATTKQYRRTVICTFPRLTYLDERPIFDGERRCAEAWQKGGTDAERAERLSIGQDTRQANDIAFNSIQRIRKEGFQKRRQSLGLPDGDTDPFFQLHGGAAWEEQEEPPELLTARQQLADMTSGDESQIADAAVTEEEARECMYGSEELDSQLSTLLPDMVVPVPGAELTLHTEDVSAPQLPIPGTETVVQSKVRKLVEHTEDSNSSQIEMIPSEAAPETDTTVQNSLKEPAEKHTDICAPQLEPLHREAAPEVGNTAETRPKASPEGIEDASVPEPVREKEEAAAESQRSCLDDLKQARGIWDNMKAILEEPTTARKPLEPLPALNGDVRVEARPQCMQHRGTGYRSSFSFIKQKD